MLENKIIDELREGLETSVRKNRSEGLLFSGGLDTSILAAISGKLTAIHISLEDYGKDLKYAKLVEKFLNLKVSYRKIRIEEALDELPEVIKILKSFDPAIPNDLAVYFGLKYAKDLGLKSIITGDGADELLGGYDFMKEIEGLDSYIKRIAKNMYFSSNELGEYFKIKIKQPYIDEEFAKFAIKLPREVKIKSYQEKVYGKWILRKGWEGILPSDIVWQDKRPLEFGSGMSILRKIISQKLTDDEFKEKQKAYPVKFLNKEHLYYYEIFCKVGCSIPRPKDTEKPCPGCGGGLSHKSFHCRICGCCLNLR